MNDFLQPLEQDFGLIYTFTLETNNENSFFSSREL